MTAPLHAGRRAGLLRAAEFLAPAQGAIAAILALAVAFILTLAAVAILALVVAGGLLPMAA